MHALHTVDVSSAREVRLAHEKQLLYISMLFFCRCFVVLLLLLPFAVRLLFHSASFYFSTLLCCLFFLLNVHFFSFFTYSFTSLFVVRSIVWLKLSRVIHFHLDTFSEYREMYLYLCEGFTLSPLSRSLLFILLCRCRCFFFCVFVFQKMCTLFAYNVV